MTRVDLLIRPDGTLFLVSPQCPELSRPVPHLADWIPIQRRIAEFRQQCEAHLAIAAARLRT